MFDDRTKKYDFDKIDSAVRTKVITEKTENSDNLTEAQKKLFTSKQVQVEKQPILTSHKNLNINDMPSSKYLQSFGTDLTVGEAEEPVGQTDVETISTTKEQSEINFDNILNEVSEVKVDEKAIKKELGKISSSPKKNYSFRIKLVTGVYCILVALFGGWVIGNAIDISHTNANIYETVAETKEVDENIAIKLKDIVTKIKQFDNGASDPQDDPLMKEMITKSIETTPEAIIEPNSYTEESNWFDVFCNWLSRIFGGN